MTISATSNYMSNDEILAWMETKTDNLYGGMRSDMTDSNTRADAEAALNKIKGDIADQKNRPHGGDCAAIHDEVNAALAQYGDIPGVANVLQPIADVLNGCYGTSEDVNVANPPTSVGSVPIFGGDADTWSKSIGDTVDNLGKKDQLSLINIQELNSEINQAKQTASALMDAADKSASAIISHIG